MVVGCWPPVSSKASHQPAGRQSISLAPSSFLCSPLVPLASVIVDSCQSQKVNEEKNPERSHNTVAMAEGSVNDWRC